MIMPVVIAGGKGTRLWPASREGLPKPYAGIGGGETTLLQATLQRLVHLGDCSAPLIVCNATHDFLAREQSAAVLGTPAGLLLEPQGRNTAPAICAAALAISLWHGSDEPMLVLPADHVISNVGALALAVTRGVDLARQGLLVTFGVAPTHAATGYGYLKLGAAINVNCAQYRVEAFVEKPDAERARGFLAQGGYAWNSGMFMFRPSAVIAAFAQLAPDILVACRSALTDCPAGPVMRLDATAFAAAEAISIDYAIMEKSDNVAAVVTDLEWSDVGDWHAVWDIALKDENGNDRRGNAQLIDCSGSLVHSDGPLVVGIGLTDMLAVATPDAVVIAPRRRAQDIRFAVDVLIASGHEEVILSRKVLRPWGSFERLHVGPGFQVKELIVKPGAKLSLQRHRFRAEHWVCVAGEGIVTLGEKCQPIAVNQAINIPLGAIHRLENPGTELLRVIEVQIGDYTGEDDIERLEDIYGRA